MRVLVALMLVLSMLPVAHADPQTQAQVLPSGHPLMVHDPAIWAPVLAAEGYAAAIEATRPGNETIVSVYALGDADGDGRDDHVVLWSHRELDDEWPVTTREELVAVSATGAELWREEIAAEDGYLAMFGDVDEDGTVDAMRTTYREDSALVTLLDGASGAELWTFEERFTGTFTYTSQGANGVRASLYDYEIQYETIMDRWDGQPGAFLLEGTYKQEQKSVYASSIAAFAQASATVLTDLAGIGVVQEGKVVWSTAAQGDRSAQVHPLGDIDGDGHDDFAIYDTMPTHGADVFAFTLAGGRWESATVPAALAVQFVSGATGDGWTYEPEDVWDFMLVSGAGDLRGQGGEVAVTLISEAPTGLASRLLLLSAAGEVRDEREYDGLVPMLTPWDDIDGDGDEDLLLIEADYFGADMGAADESLALKWSRDVSQEGPLVWYPGIPAGLLWRPDLSGDGIADVTMSTGFFEEGTTVAIDVTTGKELWSTDTQSGFDVGFVPDVDGDGVDEVVHLVFEDDDWDDSTGRLRLLRGSDLELFWSKVVHTADDNRTIDGPVIRAAPMGDADGDGIPDLAVSLNTVFQVSITCDPSSCTIDATTDPWTAGFVVSARTGQTLASYQAHLPAAKTAVAEVELGELGEELQSVTGQKDTPGLAGGVLLCLLVGLAVRQRQNMK